MWSFLLAVLPLAAAFSDAEVFAEHAAASYGERLRSVRNLDSQVSEQEVEALKARVGEALAAEQQAAATNARLRQEVNGWVNVGSRVMNREAQIISAIKHSNDGEQANLRTAIVSALSTSDGSQKPTLALAGRSSAVASLKAEEHLSTFLESWHYFLMAITLLGAALFCSTRAPASIYRVLRRDKHLEISELQLQSVPTDFGEGYLRVLPSGGKRVRTRAAELESGSSVLRFSEVLNIPARKGDGPCTVVVFQRGETQDVRIGTAIFDVSGLHASDSEYFRFKVRPEVDTPHSKLHVAMRIRDLGGTPEGAKSQASLLSCAKGPAFSV